MFKFLNLQPEIFGIDVNDLSLKIAKIKKKHKGLHLQSLQRMEIKPGIIKEGVIQDPDAFVELIKLACSTVKGEKLKTRYAIIALPEEKSFSQIIQMPKMSEHELRGAVPFEVENYIPLTVDKVYFDFEVVNVGRDAKGTHVDVALNAMPKSIVDAYVACFKKAGIVPCILEVESQAIIRALLQREDAASPKAFIDIGEANSTFIIFSNHAIRFAAAIPFSGQYLTTTIADQLNTSFERAEKLKVKYGLTKEGDKKYDIKTCLETPLGDLVAQINKYISFYQGHSFHENSHGEDKLDEIVLSGGGAYLKEFPEFLEKELKIPVSLGNPLTHLVFKQRKSNSLISSEQMLSYATVLGLALRGAQDTITSFYATE